MWKLGLRVPGDISVIGHNDIPLAAHTNPPLTTVEVPIKQLGETAAHTLLKIISGEKVERHIYLSSKLIIRESTGPCLIKP